jgi:hypothetical protein
MGRLPCRQVSWVIRLPRVVPAGEQSLTKISRKTIRVTNDDNAKQVLDVNFNIVLSGRERIALVRRRVFCGNRRRDGEGADAK